MAVGGVTVASGWFGRRGTERTETGRSLRGGMEWDGMGGKLEQRLACDRVTASRDYF